jgi:hypothetical protein
LQTQYISDNSVPEIVINNPTVFDIYNNIKQFYNANDEGIELLIEEMLAYDAVFAIDNCEDTMYIKPTINQEFFDDCSIGGAFQTITLDWTFSDICSNTDGLSITFYLEDDVAPVVLDTPEDITVYCGQGLPTAFNIEAEDVSAITIDFTEKIEVVNDNISVVIRNWIVSDVCGNSQEITQSITLDDSVPTCAITYLGNELYCNSTNNQFVGNPQGNGPFTYQWGVSDGSCYIQSGADAPKVTVKTGFEEFTLSLLITDVNGCQSYCTIDMECIDKPKGPKSFDDEGTNTSFKIYPSAVSTDLFVIQNEVEDTRESMNKFVDVRVVDLQGNVVYDNTYTESDLLNEVRLDLSRLIDGIYFVLITNEYTTTKDKILKIK